MCCTLGRHAPPAALYEWLDSGPCPGSLKERLRALWDQATSNANDGAAIASGGEAADAAGTTSSSLQAARLWLAPPSKARLLLRACDNPMCTSLEGPSEAAMAATLVPCGGCRAVWYCGPVCQQAHWKSGHEAVCCGSRTAQAAAATGGSCV